MRDPYREFLLTIAAGAKQNIGALGVFYRLESATGDVYVAPDTAVPRKRPVGFAPSTGTSTRRPRGT